MKDIIYAMTFILFFCIGFMLGIKYVGFLVVYFLEWFLGLINYSIYGIFGLIGIFINIFLIIVFISRDEEID